MCRWNAVWVTPRLESGPRYLVKIQQFVRQTDKQNTDRENTGRQNTDKEYTDKEAVSCSVLPIALLFLPGELICPWGSSSTHSVLGGGIGPEVPDRGRFGVRVSKGLLTALLVDVVLFLLLLLLLLLLLSQLLLGLTLS